MLVQLRSFFPVYPFNYCATCLGKYHTGACPTIPLADVPPPLLPPTTAPATTTEANPIGRLEHGDDDELPPLLDEDEVDDNADNDDDELPPLLDNSDLSADEEEPSSSQAQRSFVKPGQSSSSSSSARTGRGSARTPTGGDAPSDGPEGNYYDDYRYNPPLVYEQSVSFVTGAVPPIRDFSRHRAAILTFLMSQNVDVAQITDVQPTTTGFKVFLASSIALRDFGRQTECVVPTLGKVKIEVFNGYRRGAHHQHAHTRTRTRTHTRTHAHTHTHTTAAYAMLSVRMGLQMRSPGGMTRATRRTSRTRRTTTRTATTARHRPSPPPEKERKRKRRRRQKRKRTRKRKARALPQCRRRRTMTTTCRL
jgi:hypothetical protein